MSDLLVGPALLVSLLAGVVALLAPCCVSVMLPAYLSTVFGRRARVLAATVVFAAGVATVIVPIGLGASVLAAALQRWHTPLFTLAGLAMIAGGVAVGLGWSPRLPMPGGRSPAGTGVGPVYGLGVFSGVASACCAPVLVGVSVLAGATASFPAALAVSLAYVAGMVGPLLVLSLGWDRFGARGARVLQARRVPLYPGGRRRLPLGSLLSGLLLVGMGMLTLALAAAGPGMGIAGWQVRLTADLQHWAAVLTHRLGWWPGWATGLVLLAGAAGILAAARPGRSRPTPVGPADPVDELVAAAAAPTQAASTQAASTQAASTQGEQSP